MCCWLQRRTLVTYVKRIYHAFLLEDPKIHVEDSAIIATWTFGNPQIKGQYHKCLGVMVLMPSLQFILDAISQMVKILNEMSSEKEGILHLSFPGSQFEIPEEISKLNLENEETVLLSDSTEELLDGCLSKTDVTKASENINKAILAIKEKIRALNFKCVSVLVTTPKTPLRKGFTWDHGENKYKQDLMLK